MHVDAPANDTGSYVLLHRQHQQWNSQWYETQTCHSKPQSIDFFLQAVLFDTANRQLTR